MNNSWLYLALMAILIWVAACGRPAAPPEGQVRLIPMEDFFRNPEKTDFKISPDGQYLAYLAPWERRLNVHVQKFG
jgi:hypothetical protein